MESEIGRSSVPVYGKAVSTLKPRQHLCSFSLVELVVKQVRSKSYKEAADTVNGFLHLEGEDAVSHTTLKDRTVSLGMALSKEKQKQTKEILLSHGIDQENGAEPIDGTFSAATVHPNLPSTLTWNGISVAVDAYNTNYTNDHDKIKSVCAVEETEASPSRCVYISVDDVGVRHQKESRQDGYVKERKNVENTVVHIDAEGIKHYITATSMLAAFNELLAFLIVNGLMEDRRLVFLSDGARNIKEYVERFFSFRQYTIILDWYHLEKKTKEFMSMAIKAKPEDKREIIRKLLHILWVGNVADAKDYLVSLKKSNIKDPKRLGELIEYLGRKEPFIACYAVRRLVGLRTSSNKVEKANDLIVAQRQKHNGMAWSFNGSGALAAITCADLNGQLSNWIRNKTITLKEVA